MIVLIGSWLACSETGVRNDERVYEGGDFLLGNIEILCEPGEVVGWWSYDVRATGWGSAIEVEVVHELGPDVWSESHVLSEESYDEAGDWSRWYVELDQASSEAEQEDSLSTYFRCEQKTYVTYAFSAYDWDGEFVECATWGINPAGEFPDCANWGATGH